MVYLQRSVVVTWLALHETAAISAHILCTPVSQRHCIQSHIYVCSTSHHRESTMENNILLPGIEPATFQLQVWHWAGMWAESTQPDNSPGQDTDRVNHNLTGNEPNWRCRQVPTLKWPTTSRSSDNTANLLYLLSLTEGTPDLSHLLSWCSQRSEACWNRQFPWPQCSSSNSYPLSRSCYFNPLLQCSSSNSNSILIKTAVPLNLILYRSAVLLTLIHCHIAVLLIFYYSAVLLTLSLYSCSFNSNPLSQCSSNTYPLSHSCSFNPLLQCSSSNSLFI